VSGNSKIRQQRVAFSVPYFETSLKFLVAKNAGLDRIAQLDGKRVVLASAMASGQTVATAAKRRNINVRLVSAGGLPEALEMMAASKAEAMLGEDALLLGSLLITQHADKFHLIDEAISTELYSITLRRDEPEFKQLVDDVLTGLIKRGELTTLYQKWFLDPIQPYGQRVGLPLSPRNQTLFAQ
jgi:glutamate/aspartate transport system substrate-binding protein